MKRNTSLTVSEFNQMIERLCTLSNDELCAARNRMEALRCEQLPPG